MLTVHGIKTCDTCRKALKWLSERSAAHRFHDLRADGLAPADLDRWIGAVGWETMLNRRGTTWRKLPAAETESVDAAKARKLMLAHPTLIKRPVFDDGTRIVVGFGKAEQAALTGKG